MARIDKVIAAGRTYSVLCLTLTIATVAFATADLNRWILLSHARESLARWIVCDFIVEDFEDWWVHQKISGQPVTGLYQVSEELRTSRERYYSGFGSAVVARQRANWLVSVVQPTRSAPVDEATASIPDVRADIPDLLTWKHVVRASEISSKTFEKMSSDESAVELARIGLNGIFKKDNPDKAARLPKVLKEDWGADGRWLTLVSAQDKAALQLTEIVNSASIPVPANSQPPAAYRQLERASLNSTVRVPLIDIDVATRRAIWLLIVLVLLNSLVLQATLEELKVSDLAQCEEPWLLVDGIGGLRRVLSSLWLAVMALSPLMIAAIVSVTLVLRRSSGGVSAKQALVEALVLAVLTAIGGWSSFKTYEILRSARNRLAAPESVLQVRTESPTPQSEVPGPAEETLSDN